MAAAPPQAPLGSPTNPVIIDVWTGMDPLRGVNMADFWNRTLNQVHRLVQLVCCGCVPVRCAHTASSARHSAWHHALTSHMPDAALLLCCI